MTEIRQMIVDTIDQFVQGRFGTSSLWRGGRRFENAGESIAKPNLPVGPKKVFPRYERYEPIV
jgi:hypothetical protein